MNRPIPSAEAPPTLNFLPDLLLQESWQRSCCCCQDFISQEHFEQTPFSESGTRSSATHIRPSTIKCHTLQYHWLASTRFTARTLKISSEEQQAFVCIYPLIYPFLPLGAISWSPLFSPRVRSDGLASLQTTPRVPRVRMHDNACYHGHPFLLLVRDARLASSRSRGLLLFTELANHNSTLGCISGVGFVRPGPWMQLDTVLRWIWGDQHFPCDLLG